MITIKHLRIFCEVAKTKYMSKAAENLFISQPSVSTKLQEIEKILQCNTLPKTF